MKFHMHSSGESSRCQDDRQHLAAMVTKRFHCTVRPKHCLVTASPAKMLDAELDIEK